MVEMMHSLAQSTCCWQCVLRMAKEHFFYPETRPLFQKLEELSRRSGVSRAQAFEDWLTAMLSALAAETKEDEYLAMVDRHKSGKKGKRGVDLMAQMFGELVDSITRNDVDILGDLFQSSITYGEAGQFLSPESIARLLAEMSVDPDARPVADEKLLVHDPCCGTGRMLLAASNVNPHAELVGVDIDARCTKITALNLGLRGRYGWVVCGNSLTGETQFAYRIGSFFHEGPNGRRRGVIRDVPPEATPVPVIAERMRRETGDLFGQEDDTDVTTSADQPIPTIIEIPQWLARLEPRLAALDREGSPSTEEAADQPMRGPDEPPPEQQRLF